MKTFVLALLAAVLLLSSCAKTIGGAEALPGTWQVVDFEANMPDLSPALLEGAKEVALASAYTFQADHTMSYNSLEKGEWQFDASTKTLNLNYGVSEDKKTMESYQIKELSGNRMEWFQELPEFGSMTIILEKK